MKLLSEDPNNYKDAPTEGIRRIIEEEIGEALDSNGLIKTDHIGKRLNMKIFLNDVI